MKKPIIIEKFSEIIHSKFTSKATLKTYFKVAENFVNDNHPDSIDKLSKDYLLKYLNQFNPSYFNQYLSVMKILYRDVLKQKYKLKDLKPIKIKRKLKNLPSFNHLKISFSGIKNIRQKTIVLTLLSTGIRISELLNIKIKDIDSENHKILISEGKGSKSRFVALPDVLIEQLRIYWKFYKPKEYLFDYSKSSVNKFIKRYIGKEYHAHIFRHLYATYMIDQDVNSNKLRELMGHESEKTISWYFQYSNNIEYKINPSNAILN